MIVRVALVAAVSSLLGLAVVAGDRVSDDVAVIRACEEAFRQAELRYDVTTAGKLLADDFALTGMYGLFTRKQFLALIGDRSNPLQLLEYPDMDVRVYDDVAVVLSGIHEKAQFAGQPYDLRGRRTAVWIKQKGRWACVTIHVSRQGDESKSSNKSLELTAGRSVTLLFMTKTRQLQAQLALASGG